MGTATYTSTGRGGAREALWRLRLRDSAGRILGAGVLVDEWNLVTCAHIVEEAAGAESPLSVAVTVDFVALTGALSGTARVVPEYWYPATGTGQSDVAVLRLAEAAPAGVTGAVFACDRLLERSLSACGYPEGSDDGLIAPIRIVGEVGDRFQVGAVYAHDPWIAPGFSGTGVMDDETGEVVGLVAAVNRGTASRRIAWVIGVVAVAGCTSLVNPSTRESRRQSAYREIVRTNFLPAKGLLGRETELTELQAFCSNDDFYQWWQGDAWAGKSALMASFLLDPGRTDVVTVGFFITASSPYHSDRTAYAATLVDQLCTLLDEDRPDVTPRDMESVLLDRLHRAAALMWRDGKRLVLVVDGLDEDRDSSASIAALLPRFPVPGLKVLVTSRPDPHLPEDIRADHPLKSCPVRKLVRSPWAEDEERAATQEINQALREGGQLSLDVLGVVAASGGGLSELDLAALVGIMPFQLEQVLVGRFGRSLARRFRYGVGSDGKGSHVYEFAHETLHQRAVSAIGAAAIGRYRDRIHAWAQQEWDMGWTVDTPAYLLYTYPHLLRAGADLNRLLALTSQPARQQRMLALGHTLALDEVTLALDEFAARPDPGPEPTATFLAVTRLVERRAELLRSAPTVPANLPAVWAALGDLARAESLVHRVGGADQQDAARAMVRSVRGVDPGSDGGSVAADPSAAMPRDHTLMDELVAAGEVDRAIAHATGTTDRGQRLTMMIALVKALVRTEEPWRGWDLAGTESWKHRPRLRSAAIREAVRIGKVGLARQWVGRIPDPEQKGCLWAELVPQVGAAYGIDAAAAIPKKITRAPHHRAMAYAAVALLVARTGDLPRARMLAENAEKSAMEIGGAAREQWLVTVRGALVRAYSAIGDLERAQSIAETIDHPGRVTRALVEDLVPAAYAAGDTARMAHVLALISRTGEEPEARLMVPLALTVARGGDPVRAEAIIEEISDVAVRQRALTELAAQRAEAGDSGTAARLATAVEIAAGTAAPRHVRSRAVVRLALDIERLDAADPPFADAEAIAYAIDDDYGRATALADVTRALADHGYRSRAFAVAGSITYPYYRAQTFLQFAQATTTAGADGYAERALAAAARSVGEVPDDRWRVTALARLIAVLPDHHRANEVSALLQAGRDLADRIADDQHRSTAWIELAEAANGTGHREVAIAVTNRIGSPRERTRALTRAATAAAGRYDRDAHKLGDLAEQCARTIPESEQRVRARAQLVRLFVRLGCHRRAAELTERLAGDIMMIDDPALRGSAEAEHVAALVSCGDLRSAESLAVSIDHPYGQAHALSAIARSLANAGRLEDAERVCGLATYPEKLTGALLAVALRFADGNDLDRAERIALTIANPPTQAKALVGLALKHSGATAWRLATQALLVGDWVDALPAVAHASPTTARLLVGDYASASIG